LFHALPVILLGLISQALAQDSSTATVSAAFVSASIVPDVLPSFNPVFPFSVIFTDPATGEQVPVTAGVQLQVEQVQNEPQFGIVSTNPAITGLPYLIVMVDPDAPTPQNNSEAQIRHFVGPDFVGQSPTSGTFILTNQTAALSPYLGPSPPAGSPAHRYVLLMYLQSSPTFTTPSSFDASSVTNFNVTEFTSEIPGLTLVAGTYFLVAPASNSTNTTTSAGGGSTSTQGVAPSPTSPAPSTTPTGAGEKTQMPSFVQIAFVLMGAALVW